MKQNNLVLLLGGKGIYYILAIVIRIPLALFLFVYGGFAIVTTDKLCEFTWLQKLYNWYKNI